MRLKSKFTCTFTQTCCLYSGSRIHRYPLISISRATQKYSTPNPGENNQKHSPISIFPCEINARVILVTTTCYIILGDLCSKKRKKRKKEREKKRGNKKGQVPGTSKKRKSEMRGKNGQVSDSRIRGTRYPPERKEKKYRASHSPQKSFKVQERYVSPRKSKSRIRLSPLLSPSSPYTIHSPHMHFLI